MIPFHEMQYHPTSERLVGILRDRTQRDDALFFRLLVGYYFSLVASQMRCVIATPDRGDVPINMYALNLAPSGYGKTQSMNLLEEEILGQFRHRFLNETFPLLAEENLSKIAVKRAARKNTDPDDELIKVTKEFDNMGPMLFSFDSASGSAAIKHMRQKLLMARAGSLNLIMDEVGSNLIPNAEAFDTFIELFDKGLVKQKLIKGSADHVRMEEIIDKTPANMIMFGVANRLFDGAKTEEALMSMLETGYARRCFFGYIRSTAPRKMTPEEMFEARTNQANDTSIQDLADRMEALADMINAGKKLLIDKETCILLNRYQLHCEERAGKLPEHAEIQKRELSERNFKVLKLAGAYAFIDDSPEVTEQHIYNAIKLAEDSGEAFTLMLSRDKPWVRLAKYIAAVGQDVTQADLAEDLPFYRGGTGVKQEMLTLATAWGYKNNVIIKKSFSDGIEFLRGETLVPTDLSRMVLAYSSDWTNNYLNEYAPFDQLHKLTQQPDLHWVTHHLTGGYRNEDNAIPGCNLLVIDVDGTCSLSTAKLLLSKYQCLFYTTKRHTESENRFRIIFPLNYTLNLDAHDYREFYKNVLDWLPFEADTACAQRARKWMTHPGHYEYQDGDLFDALPFIPKTSKNEERKQLLNSQLSMDNLERWVINNIGDGNRNNMLLRYALILTDAGFDFEGVRQRVVGLNSKIPDKLDEAEIMTTIMVTVAKALAKRTP